MTVMNDAWMGARGLPMAPPERDRNLGYMAAGFAVGLLFSLFGVAMVAVFNREPSRADTLLGSAIGAAVGLVAVLALTFGLG